MTISFPKSDTNSIKIGQQFAMPYHRKKPYPSDLEHF